MKRKYWYEEEMVDDDDIYSGDSVEEMLENDDISPQEAAFMQGYDEE